MTATHSARVRGLVQAQPCSMREPSARLDVVLGDSARQLGFLNLNPSRARALVSCLATARASSAS